MQLKHIGTRQICRSSKHVKIQTHSAIFKSELPTVAVITSTDKSSSDSLDIHLNLPLMLSLDKPIT